MPDPFHAKLRRPLADLLRPRTLGGMIGQAHLLGDGMPLRRAFDSGNPHSMIFWGPPGVGKTTLARLAAHAFDREFVALSAVLCGSKDLREAIARGQSLRDRAGRGTILFVDEIHRFNKGQQDILLPAVASGLVTLIGATTENPSFEVSGALLSRARVYVLKSLTDDDMRGLLNRAQEIALHGLTFDNETVDTLIDLADGDARRFLNLLEQTETAACAAGIATISAAFVRDALAPHARRFDKGGEYFYDQISALHKSVRGSNPDAALYWLCRMLDGGVDRKYLARRIIAIAWDDIGLADPRAIRIANAAAQAFERLGSPDGELAFAQAVLYLACAAKSNAGGMALLRARTFVAQDTPRDVPMHLRSGSEKVTEPAGRTYRNPHGEPNAYASGETYLPEGVQAPHWYEPAPRGLEIEIGTKLTWLRQLDADAKSGPKPRSRR
ncbi:recombination factor protein RarA [Burkholderia diffusa]|uniref:Replication-associated recombination protein A n=1 Tax=Burkholderia diffusa TaxID=488732 RepID=A0AAW3PAU5_9BURK|nr:replication-associated recombination protein A [Burkholderia diffusa]KWF32854.1 recombination factor protein RarA [Burkholderia diffusa]KWF38779.1 recombination factor protein RarA [Burkholderia diffusa]KWF46824.1 recombination factor protein RarA [Burkholderia diffusa]KWF50605.1 recombination factor protein RarA [Burkholderia diffusa]